MQRWVKNFLKLVVVMVRFAMILSL